MQEAAFRAAGLDWTYEIQDVARDELPGAVDRLRSHEMAGANVTIPYKVSVIPLLDEIEGQALAVGAVNTIRKADTRLIGTNTDVEGVRAGLADAQVEVQGQDVVVLGAGGSARAVAAALAGARIFFVARHEAQMPGPVLPWSGPEWRALARRAALVVNATPLGRLGEMPLEPGDLPRQGAVLDLVYLAGGTPLLRAAAGAGLRTVDGWAVLAWQGAAAFEAWTGRPAPVAAMREALEAVA